MTHFKYRIQVGEEYTYRDSSYTLGVLVQSLLDGVMDSERTSAEVDRLLAKVRGGEVPELAPRRTSVRAEEIEITVEVVEPRERRAEGRLVKVGE